MEMNFGHGAPQPLGATPDEGGVNFAVYSEHATKIDICLFAPDGREIGRAPLPERSGFVWHGHVAGLQCGALYGFRAHGPWAPASGLRFNPAKLLLDPYARALSGEFGEDDALFGHYPANPDSPNGADSAPFIPRAVVVAAEPPLPPGPRTDWADTIIYEAHPKGLTKLFPGIAPEIAGTFDALAEPAVTAHLGGLGVTAVELQPVHAFPDDRFLLEKGLKNYWGYNSIGFFTPAPRYFGPSGAAGVRRAAEALHGAGIELILDVAYNHTAEGDERGPTFSFRGLDNSSYYRLEHADRRRYVNDTGCGNTLDFRHPAVIALALDSLRHWAAMGVDGFRFDLGATLGRTARGFSPHAPFFSALMQDPILSRLKLIAEPWDIGPGGYRLGGFPPGFSEWNDRFRDDARRFWRGDRHGAQGLASRILGSAPLFDKAGRRPSASINFITAHDGFTLADLTSYDEKHNLANGEDGADGHGENLSDNCGAEGETDDPTILSRRRRRRMNLLATLFLAQGTPMLLAGDEIGHSQRGNNNAYCQDNETTWIDWAKGDEALHGFTRRLIAYRRARPVFRQTLFLHGDASANGGPDVEWRALDGGAVRWRDAALRGFALILRAAAGSPDYAAPVEETLIAVNRGQAGAALALPPGAWIRAIDTADPAAPERSARRQEQIGAESVAVFHIEAPR
ncbi:MAG: glycogen debranching protein GlgX [Paracoccaceae bacterium]